jgi:hypothetical protein
MPPVFRKNKFYCIECCYLQLYKNTHGCISPDLINYEGIPSKYGVTVIISNEIPLNFETPIWCQYNLKSILRKQKLIKLSQNNVIT